MTVTEEMLIAYAEGALDPEGVAAVEALIAEQPELNERIARLRATRAAIMAAFKGESPPDEVIAPAPKPRRSEVVDLAAARRARAAKPKVKKPAPPRASRPARWGPIRIAVVAACLIGGIVVLQMLPPKDGPMIAQTAAGLTAEGRLARALQARTAGAAGDVRLGISFKAKDGAYCRTFSAKSGMSGLACREGGEWVVRTLAQGAPARPGQPAGEAPEISAAMAQTIVGEPLDAAGEAAAIKSGWKP